MDRRDCFTWYKLVYSESNPSPSYLDGDPYLAAISSQATGSYVASAAELVSGTTYYLRVQAIRATDARPLRRRRIGRDHLPRPLGPAAHAER